MIQLPDQEKQPADPQAQAEQPSASAGEEHGNPSALSPVEPDPSVEAPELVSVQESFEGLGANKGQKGKKKAS